jgi:sarcosine oxidase delta subunit
VCPLCPLCAEREEREERAAGRAVTPAEDNDDELYLKSNDAASSIFPFLYVVMAMEDTRCDDG